MPGFSSRVRERIQTGRESYIRIQCVLGNSYGKAWSGNMLKTDINFWIAKPVHLFTMPKPRKKNYISLWTDLNYFIPLGEINKETLNKEIWTRGRNTNVFLLTEFQFIWWWAEGMILVFSLVKVLSSHILVLLFNYWGILFLSLFKLILGFDVQNKTRITPMLFLWIIVS